MPIVLLVGIKPGLKQNSMAPFWLPKLQKAFNHGTLRCSGFPYSIWGKRKCVSYPNYSLSGRTRPRCLLAYGEQSSWAHVPSMLKKLFVNKS